MFGTPYHVTINHAAGATTLTGSILQQGQLYTSLSQIYTEGTTGDFRLDTIAISSYSDMDAYGSSILAQGTVKNFLITAPPPPVTYLSGQWTSNIWQTQFWSRTNWNYTLEKSSDLQTWSPLPPTLAGPGGFMTLQDTNNSSQSAYYRVGAIPQ